MLLDVEIFPDYGQIDVSDVTGRDLPEGTSADGPTAFTDHTVYVYTMSVDQAVDSGQNVRVRVYRGDDTANLGTLIFDRDIEFADPPRLGVYQPLTDEPEDGGGSVPMERSGPVHIQIFINPPQDAQEVNVLIRYDL
jgi:hypothetical protein